MLYPRWQGWSLLCRRYIASILTGVKQLVCHLILIMLSTQHKKVALLVLFLHHFLLSYCHCYKLEMYKWFLLSLLLSHLLLGRTSRECPGDNTTKDSHRGKHLLFGIVIICQLLLYIIQHFCLLLSIFYISQVVVGLQVIFLEYNAWYT